MKTTQLDTNNSFAALRNGRINATVTTGVFRNSRCHAVVTKFGTVSAIIHPLMFPYRTVEVHSMKFSDVQFDA